MQVRGLLSPKLQEGTDILKVIATRGATSFRWLELPPLKQLGPFARGGWAPSAFPEEEWITAQVEIRVRR